MTAPHPEQIRDAWRHALGQAPVPGHALALLLDGLPLLAADRVRDEGDGQLTLRRIVAHALAQESAAGWHVEGRPFLLELARRVLGLGHLGHVQAEEDLLLHPHRTKLDPSCADAALALARAVTAVELQHSGLLVTVVALHLGWRTRQTEVGQPAPLLPWLAPLLEDVTAQCLLVSAFRASKTNPEHDETLWLLRRLVALYEEERHPERAPWAAGPLAACCALGLLLRRPREAPLVKEFRERVEGWPGWRDADLWPTRLPEGGLAKLMGRLTERVAAAVGAADRRLWPRPGLERLLEGCWPPLLSFCVPGRR